VRVVGLCENVTRSVLTCIHPETPKIDDVNIDEMLLGKYVYFVHSGETHLFKKSCITAMAWSHKGLGHVNRCCSNHKDSENVVENLRMSPCGPLFRYGNEC